MASKSNSSGIKSDIYSRVKWLYGFFFVLGGIILLRLIWIQFLSPEIATNADKIIEGRIFRDQVIKSHRGSILSRDGEPLATSIMRYQVGMDFGSEGFDSLELYVRHTDSLSKLLSSYFGDRSTAEYRAFFKRYRAENNRKVHVKDSLVRRPGNIFMKLADLVRGETMMTVKIYDTIRDHKLVPILPRKIDYAEWLTLRTYPILNWNMGMTYQLMGDEDRIYTQGDLARRTVGALNADRGDDFGIEAVYDDWLRGEDGLEKRQRIARGVYGRVVGGVSRDAVDGLDVVTTIDIELQDVTSRILREQMDANSAIWGTTIVMEVETGDILAIANLDRTSSGSYRELRNHAIGGRAEPGSTLKLLSTMALLEAANMPTSQIYDSNDGVRTRVGSSWVVDSHKGYSEVELRTAFSQSLNVYFAKATYENFKDDPTKYTDFLKSALLDSTVGFEPFGELKPRLPVQGDRTWYPHVTLVNMGYGYGLEVSPIEMATLYNGVANGGRVMAPRLVSEIQREGSTVERFSTKVRIKELCSRSTIDTLQSYMQEVCVSGTAKDHLGSFKGFEAAAKSGTAQYAQGGLNYSDGYYIGSMVGYMPADKPKYTVFTMIHNKRGGGRQYYGAPLSGPVVKGVMQYLYNRHPEWHSSLDAVAGERVERSEKKPGGLKYLESLEIDDGVMPNLYGMGLRDAIYLLESRGVRVTVSGSGAVWRQSVKAGNRISKGSEVAIYLK